MRNEGRSIRILISEYQGKGVSSMPVIDGNVNKVGYGSWFCTQRKSNYPEAKDIHEFISIIYRSCIERFERLNLQEGDQIKLTYIGGWKLRKVGGHFSHMIDDRVVIKQKSRTISYSVSLIDEVEVVSKAIDQFLSNVNIVLTEREIKERIDEALDRGYKEEFIRLTNLLNSDDGGNLH